MGKSVPRVIVLASRGSELKNNNHLHTLHKLCAAGFKTRFDVYETLCPQQMLVYKGGQIKNWGGIYRDVTPTKV